ncbi:MAG: pilus assembly protein [Nitrospinae bacterium CG11_big_fil_rev_8_21_14_0_20_56_8]|nr:MAG: pilus assembly protein [Nitrospinae bacterium CG11_big_fil_rev_8_21_14_0_20_56_8]
MDTTIQNAVTQSPEVNGRTARVKSLSAKIQSEKALGKLCPSLIQEIKEILECEAIAIFSLDRAQRQLFTHYAFGNSIPKLRIDISPKRMAGFVAIVGKPVHIDDAQSKEDLSKLHPQLGPGSSMNEVLNIHARAMMVLPIPWNKKLVGVIEIANKNNNDAFTETDFKLARDLSPALGYLLAKLEENPPEPQGVVRESNSREEKLHQISQAIHSAKHVDDILLELKSSILELFDASLVTIYAVDSAHNEIYSKAKTGDRVDKIRVSISPVSIAGWVATSQSSVNLLDVYDEAELKKYHADLKFDSSWDKKSGARTRSMLGVPLLHDNKLMGVLQIINKKGEEGFTEEDERFANIIAEVLALAFHNQEKFVEQKPTKFSHLLNNGIITDEELTQATSKARKTQIDIESILLSDFRIQRKDLGESFSKYYGFPYFGYHDTVVLPADVLSGLNKNFLIKNYWMPLQTDGENLTILINNPGNQDILQNIRLIFPKRKIDFKVGLKQDIVDFLNSNLGDEETNAPGDMEGMSSLLLALKDEVGTEVEGDEDDEANMISETDSTIVRLVNKILIDAYEKGVSDIHVEPGTGKEGVLVRFRKDGECKIYEEIPYLYKNAILSRIKIMSRLDIAERRLPQDGKIKMKYGKKEIEYRVATCPTVGGNEDAVLRILASSKPIPLDKMNFFQRNYDLIVDKVSKPYGLVLVVGPTGSGKTTTLHSCLGYINTPVRKIWTAEDPVEITQKGLRQVQMLNKIGLDFARAMRSFLRGDPDVIMVGEMRDAETCSIGLEASLTGHLVFSTLHTNSAPETITRLLDMGMNPLNFADALLLILAQRLVRTLCKKCKADYHPSREEFDILVREYGEDHFPNLGIQYTDEIMLKKPVGCDSCGGTGYAGRTGLHELLDGTADIKRMVMKQKLVEELREQAIKDGMTTLKQDGIWKIFKGDTDLKQVLAVCIV